MMERMLGRPDEARALLLAELRRNPDPRSPAAVPLRLRLAAESMFRSDMRSAQAILEGVPETGAAREPEVELAVAAMRAMSAFADRRVGDAARHLEAADRILTAASEDQLAEELADRMDALAWLCWTDLFMGRFHGALRRLDRAVAVARSGGQSYVVANLLAGRARAYRMLGQLAEATRAAEEATAMARPLGSSQALVFALNELCLVASWRGDDEAAVRLAEEAVRASGNTEEWWGAVARYARGTALINAGGLDAGTEAMLEACDEFRSPKLDRGTLLACCEEMARVETARGRPDEATVWADRADHLAAPGLEVGTGLRRLARAHALLAPAPAAAARQACEAAEVLATERVRIHAGRARLRAGVAYAEADDRDRARDELRAAAEIFTACGARGLRDHAIRGLRRLGVRVPVPRRPHRGEAPHGLSPRELEVARLIAAGCTNPQIAERLVVSLRTVETHVSHILAKLGATSRVGVVSALAPHNGEVGADQAPPAPRVGVTRGPARPRSGGPPR
jgi:DNA-binding CsgD family transcriptional regulator